MSDERSGSPPARRRSVKDIMRQFSGSSTIETQSQALERTRSHRDSDLQQRQQAWLLLRRSSKSIGADFISVWLKSSSGSRKSRDVQEYANVWAVVAITDACNEIARICHPECPTSPTMLKNLAKTTSFSFPMSPTKADSEDAPHQPDSLAADLGEDAHDAVVLGDGENTFMEHEAKMKDGTADGDGSRQEAEVKQPTGKRLVYSNPATPEKAGAGASEEQVAGIAAAAAVGPKAAEAGAAASPEALVAVAAAVVSVEEALGKEAPGGDHAGEDPAEGMPPEESAGERSLPEEDGHGDAGSMGFPPTPPPISDLSPGPKTPLLVAPRVPPPAQPPAMDTQESLEAPPPPQSPTTNAQEILGEAAEAKEGDNCGDNASSSDPQVVASLWSPAPHVPAKPRMKPPHHAEPDSSKPENPHGRHGIYDADTNADVDIREAGAKYEMATPSKRKKKKKNVLHWLKKKLKKLRQKLKSKQKGDGGAASPDRLIASPADTTSGNTTPVAASPRNLDVYFNQKSKINKQSRTPRSTASQAGVEEKSTAPPMKENAKPQLQEPDETSDTAQRKSGKETTAKLETHGGPPPRISSGVGGVSENVLREWVAAADSLDEPGGAGSKTGHVFGADELAQLDRVIENLEAAENDGGERDPFSPPFPRNPPPTTLAP
uniref:Uncharacterized protein n=1 Tax=Phaeomonas parva TaxID=124430 RepID=A0A7S1XWL0_9STRA|mmetsp:Transcript_39978/g.125092  ORF Transcript_39978/g.125092 Transcript_39978/m.125092 type:complete len:662 (+) Transcript_39978:328-2313(+)